MDLRYYDSCEIINFILICTLYIYTVKIHNSNHNLTLVSLTVNAVPAGDVNMSERDRNAMKLV